MAEQDWTRATESVRVVLALMGAPEVAERWGEESTCAGMTVGGPAGAPASVSAF